MDLVARLDSVAIDLPVYFGDDPALAYWIEGQPSGVRLDDHRLIVAPKIGGTFTVKVHANRGGDDVKIGTLNLVAKRDWCPTPPPETMEPMPYKVGDVARFSVSSNISEVLPGMATWTFTSRSCSYGDVTLSFTETLSATGVATPFTVVLPKDGYLPNIGSLVVRHGMARYPRFFKANPDGVGYASETASAGFGHLCTVNYKSNPTGLESFSYDCIYRPNQGPSRSYTVSRTP